MPDDFADRLREAPDGRAGFADIDAEALVVDVDGFEGPLDLLLTLARTQKVDLRKISILALAEQYLGFVEAAKRLRIELAADYLVMAAWLAYLKSRLLLPPEPGEEGPSADELAAHLAFQLERLEAMRRAGARLMGRDQLGKDFFARGETERVVVKRRVEWSASLLDLMRAYSRIRTRDEYRPLHMGRPAVVTLEAALERMRSLIGSAIEWGALAAFLPEGVRGDPKLLRSAVASTFAASLEMARRGELEIRQSEAFGRISLRRRTDAAEG